MVGRGGGPIFASNHPSVSTSTRHVTESAVLPSEIEQIPGLQGKFASHPEWRRVALTPRRINVTRFSDPARDDRSTKAYQESTLWMQPHQKLRT